jgi:hypothetical protein
VNFQVNKSRSMAKQAYATSSLVIGYALCSSLLAITKFSYPGLLTALQYLTRLR